MKRNDAVYLRHIVDAIACVQGYLAGVSADRFLANRLLQDGVVRQLQIIGEAARNVSDDFKNAHPELPWSLMIGIRNRLVHVYFEVNLSIIWDTARIDLPPLRQAIERILGNAEKSHTEE